MLKTHGILFGAVYPWAGQDRTQTAPKLTIKKGPVIFANATEIRAAVQFALRKGQDKASIRAKPGEIMGYLAYGHPFLDGNGRAIMTVHSVLAQRAGFSIDWSATTKHAYLDALTKEIETPSKGYLDTYLQPFMRHPIAYEQLAAAIVQAPGLNAGVQNAALGEVLGDTDERAFKAQYEAMLTKRKSIRISRILAVLNRDIARLDALDAGLGHVGPGLGERALGVDAAAGVFDHVGFKARLARIERGPCDAEIGGQSRQEQPLHLARLQIGGEPGRGLAVGLGEGRIAVDLLVETLADDQPGLRDREILRQRRALGALHAVIGPQHLLAVGEIDGLERLLAGMRRRERDMARLCQSCVSTTLAKPLAMRLMMGTTCSPSLTARLPPGRKQFWTSITSRADASSGLIDAAAQSFPESAVAMSGRATTHDNLPPVQHGAPPCEDQSVFARSMPSDFIRRRTEVRVKKTRPNKNLERGSDLLRTDQALKPANQVARRA